MRLETELEECTLCMLGTFVIEKRHVLSGKQKTYVGRLETHRNFRYSSRFLKFLKLEWYL